LQDISFFYLSGREASKIPSLTQFRHMQSAGFNGLESRSRSPSLGSDISELETSQTWAEMIDFECMNLLALINNQNKAAATRLTIAEPRGE
jgi:hypothetical protein